MSKAIKSKHKLCNCGHCGRTVLCYKCGNNTCNGMNGEVDGKPCDECEDAYQMNDLYYKDYKSVIFSNSHEFIELVCPITEKYKGRKTNTEEQNKFIEEEYREVEERNAYARSLLNK